MTNADALQSFYAPDTVRKTPVFADGENVFSGIHIYLHLTHGDFADKITLFFKSFEANVTLDTSSEPGVPPPQNPAFHLALVEWDANRTEFIVDELRRQNPAILIYVLIQDARYENTRDAFHLGITDVISFPFQPEHFFGVIYRNLRNTILSAEVNRNELNKVSSYLMFRSDVMRDAMIVLPRISKTNFHVLISGETGTGKELVARAIHDLSPRSEEPFITVNCGAIPDTLIESELFGHEKGAFTGAVSTRRGKFELADNGTLFLDEIGDMPLKEQVKLLRVLEEKKINRVGGERSITVNVRIISATRINLEEAVKKGSFREDLYYRLNILTIHVPPLHQRNEDITLLSEYFLKKIFSEINHPAPYPVLAETCKNYLMAYMWPGNVRELRNIMTRTAILLPANKKYIAVSDIPYRFDAAKFKPNLETPAISESFEKPVSASPENHRLRSVIVAGDTMEGVELKAIKLTLQYTNGNKTEAARILNVSTRTIQRKLKEYALFPNSLY